MPSASSLFNPFCYLWTIAWALAAAHLLSVRVPFFAGAVRSDGQRFAAVDGLRGLLATSVMVYHSVVYYQYGQTGIWEGLRNTFFAFLGPGSVEFFFLITGFLFWGKCIRGSARIDARALLRSRVRRIVPFYALSATLTVIVALWLSRSQLAVPPLKLAKSIVRWMAGGVLLPTDTINGVLTWPINAGVTWSLHYEWFFYFLLPFMAWFARPARFPLLIPLFLLAFRAYHLDVTLATRFLAGMTVAHLVHRWPTFRYAKHPLISLLVVALLIASAEAPWRSVVGVTMAAAFGAIAYGNDIFGLLTTRAATLLGHVSYSIYLGHGLVLFTVVKLLGSREALQGVSVTAFWLVTSIVAAVVVLVCSNTYRYIELPFMRGPPPRRERQAPPAVAAPS